MLNILYSKHGLVLTSKCETCWQSLHHNRLIIMFHHQLLLVLHGWTGVNCALKHLRKNRWKVSSWGSLEMTSASSCQNKTASHIELIHQSVLADCLQIWYHTYPALTNFKYSVLRTCTRWFLIMLAMSSLYIKFRKFAAKKICCYTIPFHSLSFPCSALTPWICCKGGGDGKATIASS